MKLTSEFIRAIPKTDLHVHLDGSVRLPTLIDLARQTGVKLPSMTESGLRELVFKNRYNDLTEYLAGFGYTTAVLQSPESLERVACELAEDALAEGVRYIEVRFAPQLHCSPDFHIRQVLMAVNAGLERAGKRFNNRGEVRDGSEPPFHYGIIACALRTFSSEFSVYYKNFFAAHEYSSRRSIASLASLELAHAAVRLRDELGIPIVGFDLAGEEAGHPAEVHSEAYKYAHKHFMKKTVHAGEAFGPESIFQAITDLHADRIGHGYHLFSIDKLGPWIEGASRERYVSNLANYIADRRITIEVCLTSNLQTMPMLTDLRAHAFGKMLASRLSTTLCTDNRTVSQTTVSREIQLAVEHFDISPRELRNIIIYGFKRSFFHGTYLEKRAYVRRIIDYYDSVAKHPSGGLMERN
ncbi:adenosine deaminase family protein [bacterium]|nr:adenosine deaminase family protein [candidate division CSSED10-310 bacterium]